MAEEPHTRFKVRTYDSPVVAAARGQDAPHRLAIVTMDNDADHTRPTVLGEQALRSLGEALDQIEARDDLAGLLLTGKPFVFCAGADVTAFEGITPEDARRGAEAGHHLFGRIRELPYPTLAAINGAAIGGGLEIALHCDYRTLAATARPIAFSEVFLSLLPGWGGTQLSPRIVGTANALQVIVHNALDNNRMLDARQASELGFADALLEPVDFFERSLAVLEELATGEREIPTHEPAPDDEAVAAARHYTRNRVADGTRAPYLAIDLIEFAAHGGDLAEGYRREEDAVAELVPARQAQSAIYAFHLAQQRIKKQPWRPDAEARPLRKVAVVGGGLMGAQLGSLLLEKLEMPLVMKDIDEDVLTQARATIEGDIEKAAGRGKLRAGKDRFLTSLVTYTLDDADIAGADLVLEAAVEQLEVKQRILAEVERHLDPGAVVASNTSALSITEMADGLDHPERVVGLHFFNPVRVMPLLEIVRTEEASEQALATAFEVSKRLRKSGVACADTRGFILNRLLMRFNGAGIAALRHGNGFAEIDDAIKSLGLPMGPFELLGLVGVRVAHHTAQTLNAEWPDRFPLDDTFARIAELDVDGIYDWSRGREPHDEVARAVEVEDGAEPLTAEQIRQRAIEATLEEAKIMLDDGVVADPRDIDTALLLGAGWPFFIGGICKYADETGLSEKLYGQRLITGEDRARS